MLYVVATPIGNLQDITLRAVETLKSVDLIACEDTRHSRILLSHYGIQTPTTSYFEYNKLKKGEYLIGLLKEGKDVALISDAGMPGVSDPGFNIIRSAVQEGIAVVPIPGPSAFLTALAVSGKPTDRFVFEGFLPVKSAARRRRLGELTQETRTVVFYESPHRLLKALQDILEVLGDREIVICRELTKKFEEIRREKASLSIAHFSKITPKGEFVIIL